MSCDCFVSTGFRAGQCTADPVKLISGITQQGIIVESAYPPVAPTTAACRRHPKFDEWSKSFRPPDPEPDEPAPPERPPIILRK